MVQEIFYIAHYYFNEILTLNYAINDQISKNYISTLASTKINFLGLIQRISPQEEHFKIFFFLHTKIGILRTLRICIPYLHEAYFCQLIWPYLHKTHFCHKSADTNADKILLVWIGLSGCYDPEKISSVQIVPQ